MKAMVIRGAGEAAELRLEDVPDPQPGPREVLVAVKAAALNRADLAHRAGHYRQQSHAGDGPRIGGLEAAGEVISVGDRVTRFLPGDRVMSQCVGGYAELVTIDERLPIPVPDTLDWKVAAATPVGFVTAHDALSTNARIQPGETVLIQGAEGGVGLIAVQVARFLGAGKVFGTIGDERKFELSRSLGLDILIDYRREKVSDVVERHTAGRGVDIVIDHVGGPALAENVQALALRGRLVSVGRLGSLVGDLDLDLLALKRLHLIGVTFRTRTLDEFGECVRRAAEDLLPALADGRLKAIVDSVFPLEQAEAAQQRMADNQHVGKIVLSIGEGGA